LPIADAQRATKFQSDALVGGSPNRFKFTGNVGVTPTRNMPRVIVEHVASRASSVGPQALAWVHLEFME